MKMNVVRMGGPVGVGTNTAGNGVGTALKFMMRVGDGH